MTKNSVNTNVAALKAATNLARANKAAQKSIARLSSGEKIVEASDDAAGGAISNSLKAGLMAKKQASSNAMQGSSLIEIGNGALTRIYDALARSKVLALQSKNGAMGATEKSYIQAEFSKLRTQIGNISGKTDFNGTLLLNGGSGTATAVTTATAAAVTGEDTGGTLFAANPTMTGMVIGQASGVVVTKVGSNWDIQMTVGNQTFEGSVAGGAGAIAITLTSKTNIMNSITMTSAATVLGTGRTAAQVAADVNTFLATAGASTIFHSAAGDADANGTTATATAGANTKSGPYYLSYTTLTATTGTLTLTQSDGKTYTESVTGATNLTHTFDNGLTVTLGANGSGAGQFDLSANLATPLKIEVSQGTQVSMDFATGETVDDYITLEFPSVTTDSLDLDGLDLESDPDTALTTINNAIKTVNTAQAELGAIQSQFNLVLANLDTLIENTQAVKGTFADTDMANEFTAFTNAQVLADAAVSMLAQANAQPQKLVQLLK